MALEGETQLNQLWYIPKSTCVGTVARTADIINYV